MSVDLDHIRDVLAAAPTPLPLARDDYEVAPSQTLIPAAVMIAITEAERPGLILTIRREDMRTHAGQVAFPGGRIDPGEDPVTAALREAEEEIGLPPAKDEVLATLDPYRTGTAYEVVPVVGIVPAGLDLAPHEAEVAGLFEAPLDHLLDPEQQQARTALFHGRMRHYYEIEWDGHRIWGATAAMIVNLSARLQWR